MPNDDNRVDSTPIDKDRVEKMVKEMVKTNGIGIIPDRMEEKIYTNVFTMILRILDSVINDLSIKFLGHELKLDIAPKKGRKDDGEGSSGPNQSQ